jgi:hypothetical protein
VEAVAERMSDHVVGHHPTMPSVGKTAQAVIATRRLKDSSHAFMMTILSRLCKTMAPASSAKPCHPRGPAKYDTRLVAQRLPIDVENSPTHR